MGRWIVSVLGVAAVVWIAPVGDAHACSCAYSLDLVEPSSDTYPSNAGVLLHASCGGVSAEAYRATVDGVSAELVPNDDAWLSVYGLAMIDPAPASGQEVVIESCTDELVGGCLEEPEWTEVVRYTATEPDTTAPLPGGTASLEHRANDLFPDCISDDLEFVATVTDVAEQVEPILIRGILSDADGTVVSTDARFTTSPTDEIMLFFSASSDALAVPPEALCVEVSAIDFAGNIAVLAQSCGSVGEPGDPTTGDPTTGDPTTGDPTTGDPTTGSAPDTSGGPDEDGSDGGSAGADGETTDRGCACATRSEQGAPWLLSWTPLALAFVRRRRLPQR